MIFGPVRLTPSPREKIWGATELEPWFRSSSRKIGEVWFLHPEGNRLPILVKLIYTTEPLSVQVHPDDAYAQAREGTPGKTEMWYVLRAAPGAGLSLGLREAVPAGRLRQAARNGEIEGLLGRFPLTAGEVYFVPPGTVHAIGAGLVLCEIQQNTDLTYRLYDYGRPRELHLEKAVECAEPGPHSGKSTPERLPDGGELLARCDYFATERWSLQEPAVCRWKPWTHQQLVVVEGAGWLGEEPFGTGDVWLIPPGEARTELRPSGSATLLCTYLPEPAA